MVKQCVWAGVAIVVLVAAWVIGQPTKVKTSSGSNAPMVVDTNSTTVKAELTTVAPQPLTESVDLSRAFQPVVEEEVSPIVLTAFTIPDEIPAKPSLLRYRTLLMELDAISPMGLRLSWLSNPLPDAELLTIMPRIAEK